MDFAPSLKNIIPIMSILLCVGCAEIGAPPGGEVDKVKPRLLESFPENGSTNVEPSDKIIIKFSERILKPTQKRSIYISPRLATAPTIKWNSDNITITLPDSFAVDQTYIISFPDGVQDLRRNPLDSGSIIAFTTGETLANGIIEGKVINQQNVPQNKTVTALYKKSDLGNIETIDSLYPTYLSVTNSDGLFSFKYIPDGEYLLLAFTDKDQNDKLDQELELYGMTDREIVLDSSSNTLHEINITLAPHPKKKLEILSVRQTKDNILKIDLNNHIATNTDQKYSKISLRNYNQGQNRISSLFNIKADSAYSSSIEAYFGQIDTGSYKLNFRLSNDDSLIVFDSIRIKESEDKLAPSISIFRPNNARIFQDSADIYIQFSEPLDTSQISNETFYLLDNDSNFVLPKFEFLNSSLCKFSSDFIHDTTYQYKLHISEFDIFDLAGNKMGDSVTFRIINIINEDSLGVIRGEITQSEIFNTYKDIILSYYNIATNQTFTQHVSGNIFVNTLPQGKYFLNGFIDMNKNNKRDFGEINSLKFAEPYIHYNDTIKIRARFETTDITLEFK